MHAIKFLRIKFCNSYAFLRVSSVSGIIGQATQRVKSLKGETDSLDSTHCY